MGALTIRNTFVVIALITIAFAAPTEAFGAGFVPRGASNKGTNYRHGDILYGVYFLSHAHSTLVRQIYFGNWLRDFSQLMDRKAMELVPEPILRTVVAVFAYLQFGYTTGHFEVTPERLGFYKPEEHIDNPRGYEGGAYSQLRPATTAEEIGVDSVSGMKNYIANQKHAMINDTSLDFIERQLVAAIACGRSRDAEAYNHLGGALHTLEDFLAHSNWVELCIQMVGQEVFQSRDDSTANGMTNVFAFTGDAARVKTIRGKVSPLVTGTFGALDLYQTLLGEIDDKLNSLSLESLKMRIHSPDETISSTSKTLIGLFNKFGDNDIGDDIKTITKSATEKPADWGKLTETPELLWNQLYPIFRLRDKIVRWVYDHLTVDAVANAIATISTALDKLVYRVIGIFMGPVLKDISLVLRAQADALFEQDQQVRMAMGEQSVFGENSAATDPTHSQLCKDHYDHELNELAGRVATKVTTFTIKKIVELWQPGSTIDPRPHLTAILETLHHPFNYSKESEIQSLMVAEVVNWCTLKQQDSPQIFANTITRLDQQHMAAKLGEETERLAHTHVPAMTATYAQPHQISQTTAHDLTTVSASGAHIGFIEKITANIEKGMNAGSFPGLTISDLPGIKQILHATPSADVPNPVDQSISKIQGVNLLSIFEGIDNGEMIAAPGMGIILKDGVITMRLRDTARVEREQVAAQERLGALEDRPTKELLALLDFGAEVKQKNHHTNAEEGEDGGNTSKARRLVEKLKIGGS